MIVYTVQDFIDEGALDWKLDDDEVMKSKEAEIYRFIEHDLKEQCEQTAQGLDEEDYDTVKSLLLDNFELMELMRIAKQYNMLHNDVHSEWYCGNNFLFMRDLLGAVLFEEMPIEYMVSQVIDGILYQQKEAQEDEDD